MLPPLKWGSQSHSSARVPEHFVVSESDHCCEETALISLILCKGTKKGIEPKNPQNQNREREEDDDDEVETEAALAARAFKNMPDDVKELVTSNMDKMPKNGQVGLHPATRVIVGFELGKVLNPVVKLTSTMLEKDQVQWQERSDQRI